MAIVAHAANPLLEAAPAAEWTACAGGANIREQGLAPTGIKVARATEWQSDPSLWEAAPAAEWTACAGGANIREQGLAPTGIKVARATEWQSDPSLWEAAPAAEWMACTGGANIREQGLAPTGIKAARATEWQSDPSLWEAAPAAEWTACTGEANIREQGLAPTKHRSKSQKGFTLVELLVAMTIATVLIGLAPIAYNRLQEGSQYRDTLRTLVTELRTARQLANSQRQLVTYRLDVKGRQYGLDNRPAHRLPDSLQMRVTSAQGLLSDGQSAIVFLPEGGSSGGVIELQRGNGTGTRIRVDWLWGQIQQEPL